MKDRFKVIIVDDEFRIGVLIEKLIEWEKLGLQCLAVLDNGEAAYQAIMEKDPDIVITDVRMPRVNGLDLIQMTKERKENVQFIVVSGYKEFEYAHRALQYGVNHYLLKPIDEDELNNVLKELIDKLISRHEDMRNIEEMEKTVQTSKFIIRENVLKHLMNPEKEVTSDEIEVNYQLELKDGLYQGIDVKLDYWDYEKSDSKQDKITTDRVISIIESNLEGIVKEQLICQKENLHIYCLMNYEADQMREVRNCINKILSELKAFLIRFEQYEVTIGIGTTEHEIGKIRHSIQEANHAVQNRIKCGTGRLIYVENLTLGKSVDLKEIINDHKDDLRAGIDTYNRAVFEQSINQIYAEIQTKEGLDYANFYYLSDELVEFFFDTIDVDNKEGKELKQFLLDASQHCYSVIKLKGLLKEYMGEYLDVCMKNAESATTKPIREIQKYIEEHYAEKILLEDVAEIVELNPVYLSTLFKKETGKNFSTYLTNVRIDVAKGMLCSSNETIAAIADRVGYKDTRYFSQTFTKLVGIKPILYRKLHS